MADTPTQNAERNFTDAERFLFSVYSGKQSGDIANLGKGQQQALLAVGEQQLFRCWGTVETIGPG